VTRNSFFSSTQIKNIYPDIYMKIVKLERNYDFCTVKNANMQGKPKEIRYKTVEDFKKAMKCLKTFKNFKEESELILEEIRYRNRINTSLEQIFERTLHLNEVVDCNIY
jgi:hypothetical protein